MTQFDPMAIMVDWLDAYRAGEIDTMIDFYTDDMMLECSCDGEKTIVGKAALTEYWRIRLADPDCEASALEQIWLEPDGAALEYQTPKGPVRISFRFDETGKVSHSRCAPQCSSHNHSQIAPQIQPE